MSNRIIEYVDEEGCLYRVWSTTRGKLRCEAYAVGEVYPKRITDLNAFSKPVFDILMRAIVWIYPQGGNRIDPTEQGFRFHDHGGCGGPCPEFAS